MSPAYLFAPAPQPSVAVQGQSARFPVRRIYCVGRNYSDHAREMGYDPRSEVPFFFDKPADALVADGGIVPYPTGTANLHHEVELVLAIGAGGRDIVPEQAQTHILGYAVGIDMTRRDVQAAAKQAGKPWTMAKGFDYSAPVGAIALAADIGHPRQGRITLSVSGSVRQDADIAEMTWSPDEIVAALSREIVLAPGDLIFTGTPAGVGPVAPGDTLEAEIAGIGRLAVSIG
jgi:fumarylpyruvate hydrolase